MGICRKQGDRSRKNRSNTSAREIRRLQLLIASRRRRVTHLQLINALSQLRTRQIDKGLGRARLLIGQVRRLVDLSSKLIAVVRFLPVRSPDFELFTDVATIVVARSQQLNQRADVLLDELSQRTAEVDALLRSADDDDEVDDDDDLGPEFDY